jgi:hypothetical protein
MQVGSLGLSACSAYWGVSMNKFINFALRNIIG